MKILLIGGTSSIGNALIPALSEFSEVITAGRRDCNLIIDLNEPISQVLFPSGIEVVVHTAANFGGESDTEILEAERVNVLGTLNVCQAAARAKVRHFILISSIFTKLDFSSNFYNVYALSKKQAEEVANFYCMNHSLPLTILRPSQIYGVEDIFRKHQPFLYTIADKAEIGENITFNGSNDALRNFIHIDDID